MKIMLVGGGTGGHIQPLLAVAHELKSQVRDIEIIAVIDETTHFAQTLHDSKDIDRVEHVKAGKFRRYPNQSLLASTLDIKTNVLNIRDGFRTLAGIFQSLRILKKHKPEVIFIKGGFVGVPIGIAAHVRKVPFITHDSDIEPGLANKIIGRWAELHTVGMPASNYPYPQDKTVYVGIPVANMFKTVTSSLQRVYRQKIEVPMHAKVVFVTGGSQGAQNLNSIVVKALDKILVNKDVYVFHQTGPHESQLPANSHHYRHFAYDAELYRYSGAADVIISRAGSSVAEFACQHKAVIVVPAAHLAGDHQTKNAAYLKSKKAAAVFSEAQLNSHPWELAEEVNALLTDSNARTTLADNLTAAYPADAEVALSQIILDIAGVNK